LQTVSSARVSRTELRRRTRNVRATNVLHTRRGHICRVAAEVALDDPESEVDAGREPTGGRYVLVLDETAAAYDAGAGRSPCRVLLVRR
jgi:hypothetical protein